MTLAASASAAVTYTFDTPVAEEQPNSAPLVVTVTEVAANTVEFKVDASDMISSEFVRSLFFNVDDNLTLSVVSDNGAAAYDFCPYDRGCGSGPFDARGNRGRYDLLLDFATSNSSNRL